MQTPKIVLHSLTSGSGVETAGDTVASMFDGYATANPGKFIHHKDSLPPYVILEQLVERKPDVIILNELHQRAILGVHSYKIAFPDTKIILLNHCYPYIVDYPVDENSALFEWTNKDGVLSINHFLGYEVDHIINLNYIPTDRELPDLFKERVVCKYFPLQDSFRKILPLQKRPYDFLFYGTVHPLKFSVEFLNKISDTSFTSINMYGRWMKDANRVMEDRGINYEDYKAKILNSRSLKWKGWMAQEEMTDIINQHKCFVMPHDGSEPFCLALAEAIRCGCIAMVTNDRSKSWSGWIDWAKGNYLEYQSVDKLIEKMEYFSRMKHDGNFMKDLDRTSTQNSTEMSKKTDYNDFKELLFSYIFS